MKLLLVLLFLLGCHFSYSQDFLSAFRQFRQQKIKSDKTLDSISKTPTNAVAHLTRKKINRDKNIQRKYLEIQIRQLDSVFKNYHLHKEFNFNDAGSLVILCCTSIETQLRSFLIISGNDTAKYSERFRMWDIHDLKREIIYDSSFSLQSSLSGYKNAIDTIFSLILIGDLTTARDIENKYGVLDGSTLTITTANKIMGQYKIEEFFFKPVGLVPISGK